MSKNKNAYCSFCKKSFEIVGPLVEGPGEVYICGGCIQLSQSIIDQEEFRRSNDPEAYFLKRIDDLPESIDYEVHTINERLRHLAAKKAVEMPAISGVNPTKFLLAIVDGILERTKAKGLNSEELALLERVVTKVAQLRMAINARADKGLQGMD